MSLRPALVIAIVPLFIGCVEAQEAEESTAERAQAVSTTIEVSGSGVDHLDTAIVHTQEYTQTGLIQQSTETVDLFGDLNGRVLYHVTSVFDFVAGTLDNSGDQVFSGTVAGSAPTLVHDNDFTFHVNLFTGEEYGNVYLVRHIAGANIDCTLEVVGTGVDANGNPTFDYSGECTIHSGNAGDAMMAGSADCGSVSAE